MEKAERRSAYMLAGFLVLAYTMPFAIGIYTENVFFDRQWLADLATVVLNGVMQGGVYAMFAVGLTMIFGVMRIINVAHGEMVMLGAYLSWMSFFWLGFDPLLAMVFTLPIAFGLGWMIQKFLLNAVVGGPELTPLLMTFGLGLAMIYAVEAVFTTDFKSIPYAPDSFQLSGSIVVGKSRLISFVMALVISVGVFMFLKKHRIGKAIRATSQNADVAMVCGINIYGIYMITSGISAALAVAGGVLVSIQFGFNPETGIIYTLQAFAIIVLGGRGHYIGAMIGGVMLAVMESLISFMLPNGTALVEIAAYGLMIFVLLIRPRGLMGPKTD
ncbi:MAG: branched-chain amino acid ABC transporter permease [Nitrospinota bacterium]|nr:branched-chain amino acid ABC transporter permease [Nitrospinota bacterium]